MKQRLTRPGQVRPAVLKEMAARHPEVHVEFTARVRTVTYPTGAKAWEVPFVATDPADNEQAGVARYLMPGPGKTSYLIVEEAAALLGA